MIDDSMPKGWKFSHGIDRGDHVDIEFIVATPVSIQHIEQVLAEKPWHRQDDA